MLEAIETTQHMNSKEADVGLFAVNNISFRWGGTLTITDAHNIAVVATERGTVPVGSDTHVNANTYLSSAAANDAEWALTPENVQAELDAPP